MCTNLLQSLPVRWVTTFLTTCYCAQFFAQQKRLAEPVGLLLVQDNSTAQQVAGLTKNSSSYSHMIGDKASSTVRLGTIAQQVLNSPVDVFLFVYIP